MTPHRPAADLAARVATALADRYRIERELGEGGMATVYLAEDLKHRRQVAVKVLRPELAESIGGARFLREIEIAAQLTHPHILPLLDSGEAGDLLYYVMPYIEGESLRAKLAREGALPVSEASRYLREVADALAYAHGRGLVHRDIKPENVMLAGRHAMVMDFGVAKAVSEAAGEGLTTVGMTLGTPAYMAPEQAVADPHIDHRADLYALGVVGYEMIAGRTPFEGMTPQQALAAHVTRSPDPLGERTPACPPALAALIMRCLAKQRDERPQSATELVALLEGVATPSGGTAPAVVPISGATQAAIRRGHPGRVAAMFVIASIIVLAVVRFLVLQLGLPDWVFWGAGVLLAMGLPIMLMTGLRERQRAIARTTSGQAAISETGVGRLFTWQRALAGGAAGFAGLAIVTGVYTAMRLLGVGPVGTLVASGVLNDRERLLLADFENRTADSTLGPSMTEAFRVDLSQSQSLRLIDGSEITDMLNRMERPAVAVLTPALAREVAERGGIKAVVAGQIDPVGTSYVLSVTLLSAVDGRVLTAVRETADNPSALLKAIDKLSAKLRERIGESLVTIRGSPPLERVTTSSLPALRKYSAASRLVDLGRDEEAIPLLEEATGLDTGFAMGYRKLAVAISNSGGSLAQEAAASTQAFLQRDRLTDIERELATAWYYSSVKEDAGRETAAYRSALSIDPDNAIAITDLALRLNLERHWVEGESLATHGLKLRSTALDFDKVVLSQIGQGRLADARATVEQAARTLPPGTPDVLEFQFFIALARRDYTEARRFETQEREQHKSPGRQMRTSLALARLAETQGRLGEAAQHLHDYMAEAEGRGLARDYLVGATELAQLDLRYRSRPADALATVQAALVRHPLDSMSALDRPYLALARVYADAGKLELAHRALRDFEAAGSSLMGGPRDPLLAYGRVAEVEGRPGDAITVYRRVYEETGLCGTCGLFELASLYDRQGQADSARVLYEREVNEPTAFGHLIVDRYALAPTYKRLGELYEAKGDRKKAADYYNRFAELWKDADPELQPGVKEVRGRLARLSQEPGT